MASENNSPPMVTSASMAILMASGFTVVSTKWIYPLFLDEVNQLGAVSQARFETVEIPCRPTTLDPYARPK